jgi:hypothetical protein
MTSSFLESTFLVACPELRPQWDALRRARAPGDEPTAAEFMGVVRHHVLGLLLGGRIAEFSRFSHTVERLLGDADPVLADLLRAELIEPLAAATERSDLAPASVVPYLGPRTRAIWRDTRGGAAEI